jgi:hypothetical protein
LTARPDRLDRSVTDQPLVLITGAAGDIGSRLVKGLSHELHVRYLWAPYLTWPAGRTRRTAPRPVGVVQQRVDDRHPDVAPTAASGAAMNGIRDGMRSMSAAWRNSSVARRARSGHEFMKAMRARIDEGHLTIVAAGVAFYGMLAIFSALAAMVAIYSLMLDPAQVGSQIAAMAGVLPADALGLLVTKLDGLSRTSADALGLAAAAALAVT